MLNKNLLELYKNQFQDLTPKIEIYNKEVSSSSRKNNRATNALLLKVNDDWLGADLKVMIFGQETNFWGKECSDGAVFCNKIEENLEVDLEVDLDDGVDDSEKEEIDILKPDVLIFFTGPRYDHFIELFIGKFDTSEISGFEKNQLCNIKFKDDLNIKKAIRTYHPGYLYRKNLRKPIIDRIISELNNLL